jgi:ribosomal protein L29
VKKAITEIRGMDTAELRAQLSELRKEQFGLKFRGSPEQVKQTSRRVAIRRTIARILMVLADRESAAAGAKSANTAKPAAAAKSATGAKPVGAKR